MLHLCIFYLFAGCEIHHREIFVAFTLINITFDLRRCFLIFLYTTEFVNGFKYCNLRKSLSSSTMLLSSLVYGLKIGMILRSHLEMFICMLTQNDAKIL